MVKTGHDVQAMSGDLDRSAGVRADRGMRKRAKPHEGQRAGSRERARVRIESHEKCSLRSACEDRPGRVRPSCMDPPLAGNPTAWRFGVANNGSRRGYEGLRAQL